MPQASVCILHTYNHYKMMDREAAHLTCDCDGADLSWIRCKQLVQSNMYLTLHGCDNQDLSVIKVLIESS